MPVPPPADWQLPPGVSRGLWDYLHDPAIARTYDERLADCSLLEVDRRFAERYFDRPAWLIDLGCGTGRLLLPFARRGYAVVGADLSAEMLVVVGVKAAAAGVEVHRLRANLVELDCVRTGAFDYAACLFSTLGMVTGAAERQRALARVYRVLRPGGRFVLHVHNRWFSLWDAQGRRWLVGDCLRALAGRVDHGDRAMPVHQGIAGLTLHLFSRREAVRLLRGVGFRVLEVQPVSLRPDGRLRAAWCLGGLRAYGYLLAAERPGTPVISGTTGSASIPGDRATRRPTGDPGDG
jgi:SAM-dependent methyltransferase